MVRIFFFVVGDVRDDAILGNVTFDALGPAIKGIDTLALGLVECEFGLGNNLDCSCTDEKLFLVTAGDFKGKVERFGVLPKKFAGGGGFRRRVRVFFASPIKGAFNFERGIRCGGGDKKSDWRCILLWLR